MKKLVLLSTLFTAISFSSGVQARGPSSIFNQEIADVVASGEINLDLYNTGATQLRIGAFSGELHANLSNNTLSYKAKLSDVFAAYGGLGISTNATGQSTNTLVVGAAYTKKSDKIIFNINPLISNSAGNTSVDVNLGAFLPMAKSISYPGRLLPGIGIYAPISPSGNSVVLLGVRWEVKSNLTLEAGLYNSGTGLQFPGMFHINLSI